jgi:hypothetical protein
MSAGLLKARLEQVADLVGGGIEPRIRQCSGRVDARAGDAVLAVGSVGAAAWNPATANWTALPSPPYQGSAVQIWTGTQPLIWGQLSDPPSRDPSAGDPRQVTEPTGLELTR